MSKPHLKKRILQHPLTISILSAVVAAVLRVIHMTLRKHIHMDTSMAPYADGTQQAIFCFWHGRLLMQAFMAPKKRKMRVMVSQHNDGELITRVIERFGVGTVRGSRKKGATSAILAATTHIEAGDNIAITPDGPRGPHHIAAMGAIWLAKSSGLPIIPVSTSLAPAAIINSWDRFMIPYPFARSVYIFGDPMYVDANADDTAMEDTRLQLQELLNALTHKADAQCGYVSSDKDSHA